MARNTWYRLDNIGKFYSSQAGSTAQTVFRFSATLTEEVDADILQHAVEKTVSIFPSFNVCLRSGMFWHYLEQSDKVPEVHPENLPICFGLHVSARSVLFRVSYYQNRINVEVSHIVSDGRGTTSFFKALLYAYLEERYGLEGITIEYDGSDNQKAEDSFDKYYERDKSSSTRKAKRKDSQSKKPKVYRLAGWKDQADPTYMELHLPVREVKELAQSMGVSMTSLLIAALVGAIRTEMPKRYRKRAIRIGIPVDLRAIFGSATIKNFFGLSQLAYVPEDDTPIEALAPLIQDKLKAATSAEQLKPRMNRMIKLEKNLLLRFSPVFVKDYALELADYLTTRDITTTVSNLGQIPLADKIAPYVQNMNLLTSTTGLNFVICSCGNDLSIGISTVYASHDVLKHFCRYFSLQGIPAELNISKTDEEVAADWREAKRESDLENMQGLRQGKKQQREQLKEAKADEKKEKLISKKEDKAQKKLAKEQKRSNKSSKGNTGESDN